MNEEKQKFSLEKDRLEATLEVLEGDKAFLTKLEGFAVASTTNATEKGKLDSNETITLAKYLTENRKSMVEQRVNA